MCSSRGHAWGGAPGLLSHAQSKGHSSACAEHVVRNRLVSVNERATKRTTGCDRRHTEQMAGRAGVIAIDAKAQLGAESASRSSAFTCLSRIRRGGSEAVSSGRPSGRAWIDPVQRAVESVYVAIRGLVTVRYTDLRHENCRNARRGAGLRAHCRTPEC